MKALKILFLLTIQIVAYSCSNTDGEPKMKLKSIGDIYVDQFGDTINRYDDNNLKQGKWQIFRQAVDNSPTQFGSLESEGYYKDNKKDGYWKRYSVYGELIDSIQYVDDVQKTNGTKTYSVTAN